MQQSKGGSYYLKIGAGTQEGSESAILAAKLTELLGGDVLFLQNPVDSVEYLVAGGYIDQAEADARIAKIPEFIKFNVNLPKKG